MKGTHQPHSGFSAGAILTVFLSVSHLTPDGAGAPWPHWRGPSFNGSSPETNLVSSWTKTENVAWSIDLPGPAAATPIVFDNVVLISTTDAQTRTLHAMAVEKASGKILWQHKIADAFQKERSSNYASPSPTTDGKTAVFFFGNGDLFAFDMEGKKLWSRNLQTDYGDFAFLFTFSSSPTLFGGKIFMQVLQRDVPVGGRGRKDTPIESFLLAIDALTGKTVWKQSRPTAAVEESHEAYSTPIPVTVGTRHEIIVAGGDCLTGHDPDTGKELWRWETWNPRRITHWRLVPSPVQGGEMVLTCAPKGSPVYAIKLGGTGLLGHDAILWTSQESRDVSSDVPTPLFYMGDFFVLNDLRGILSRIDATNGKPKWSARLPGRAKYEASPTGADGKVYLLNFRGEVVVVDANSGAVISTIPLGEQDEDRVRSSVAVADKRLFVRTNRKLYAIGPKS